MGLSQIRRDRNTGLRAARGAERTLNRGVLAYAPLIERRLTNLLPARWRATGPSTTAGVEAKSAVSNGFCGPAADAGGASATRGGRPRGQAAGPRPGARADGALPAR